MPGRDESLPGIWPHVYVLASISSVALRTGTDAVGNRLPQAQEAVAAAAALRSAARRSGLAARRSGLAAGLRAAGRGGLAAGLRAAVDRLAALRLAAVHRLTAGRSGGAAARLAAARSAAALLLVAVAEQTAEEAFLLVAAARLAAALRLAASLNRLAALDRRAAARGRSAAAVIVAEQTGVSGARADATHQQGGTQSHPLHSDHLLEINFGTNVRISGVGSGTVRPAAQGSPTLTGQRESLPCFSTDHAESRHANPWDSAAVGPGGRLVPVLQVVPASALEEFCARARIDARGVSTPSRNHSSREANRLAGASRCNAAG